MDRLDGWILLIDGQIGWMDTFDGWIHWMDEQIGWMDIQIERAILRASIGQIDSLGRQIDWVDRQIVQIDRYVQIDRIYPFKCKDLFQIFYRFR